MSNLRVRFKAYDSAGAFLGFLRPSSWSASVQHNDAGTLSMTYPRVALNGGILQRGLEQGLEIGMEVAAHDSTWVEPYNCRFLLVSRSRDAKDATDTVTLNCMTWIWLAKKILNLNMGALLTDTDNKGKRPFYSATSGMIVHTLLDENRERGGAATVMPAGFNSSQDTNGDTWASKMTLYYDPGVDLYTVIDNLSANGLCDWRTDGRMLKMWNADSTALCRDLSGRVRIQLASGLLESPEEETIEGLAGNILIRGDNDLVFTQENKSAPTPWGKWELYSSQGGVSNKDTAQLMMQTQLASAARVRGQYTRQILTDDIDYLPLVDYRPGDWITAPTVTHGEKVRVQRVELSNRNDGGVKCALMLNDRLYDAQTRQAKRIQGITGGAVAGGASGATPAPEKDHRVPKAPTGLVVQTDAYLDANGYARGLATAHWAAVTQATNSTSIEISSYRVEWRPNTAGETWRSAGVTTDTTLSWGNLDCGTTILVRVRAVPTYSDRLGEWSDPVPADVARDATPPSVPSVPVLASETGIVTIHWDGKTASGALMETDFDHVEVGRGTGSTNISMIAATQSGAGDYLDTTLADGDVRYYALRAVDHAGNRSQWSATAQITCHGAISSEDLDRINQTITENKEILDQATNELSGVKNDVEQAKNDISENRNALTTANRELSTVKNDAADAKTTAGNASSVATQANATAASAQQAATSAQTAANILMQQAADLQPNSGFEHGTDYWATNVTGAAFVETSQSAHSGARRAYLKRGLGTKELIGTQTVRAVTDRRYRLSIWYKLINMGMAYAGGLRLQYSTDGKNWTDTSAKTEIRASDGDAWAYSSCDLVATSGTPLLRARLAYNQPVDMYVDDFRLQDITEAWEAQQAADTAQATAAQAKKDAANADAKAVSAAAAAAGAQTTADSKSTVYTQPDEPAHDGLTPGDVWRRTSTAAPETRWLGEANNSVSVLVTHSDEVEETLVWNGSRFTPYYLFLDSLAVTGSISTDLLAANAVTAEKIKALAISTDKLAANAVNADKIAANSVTADKIKANSVVSDKIAANAVTTAKIAALAVNADKIAANAITAEKIAALAITADKIAAGTITSDKIKAGQFVGYVFTGAVFQSHTEDNKGFKLHDVALDMWNANGDKTVHLDGEGNENILVGTLQTALSGDRIVISPKFSTTTIGSDQYQIGSGISFPLSGTYAMAPYIATQSNDSKYGSISTITINGGMRTDGSAGAGTGFGSFMRIGQTRNASTKTEMATVYMTANCDYLRKSADTSRREWRSSFELSQTSGDGSAAEIIARKPNALASLYVRADDAQNNGATWVRIAASVDNKKPVGILANSQTGILHLGGYLGGMDGRATFAASWSENSSNTLKEYAKITHTFGITPPAYGRYKSMVSLDSDKPGCYWSASTCNEKSGSFRVIVRAMPRHVMVNATQYAVLFDESNAVRYNLVTLSYLISS